MPKEQITKKSKRLAAKVALRRCYGCKTIHPSSEQCPVFVDKLNLKNDPAPSSSTGSTYASISCKNETGGNLVVPATTACKDNAETVSRYGTSSSTSTSSLTLSIFEIKSLHCYLLVILCITNTSNSNSTTVYHIIVYPIIVPLIIYHFCWIESKLCVYRQA